MSLETERCDLLNKSWKILGYSIIMYYHVWSACVQPWSRKSSPWLVRPSCFRQVQRRSEPQASATSQGFPASITCPISCVSLFCICVHHVVRHVAFKNCFSLTSLEKLGKVRCDRCDSTNKAFLITIGKDHQHPSTITKTISNHHEASTTMEYSTSNMVGCPQRDASKKLSVHL